MEEEVKTAQSEGVQSEEAAETQATEQDSGAGEKQNEAGEPGSEKTEDAGDNEGDSACESADGTETEDGDAKAEEPEKKRGFFGKKKDKKDEQIEELNDKNRRLMAEFDNFRKRTEKEKAAMFEIGAKSVIEKILPVVDNFERGLATVPEDKKDDPVAQGMEKIYKQMTAALEEIGVKPIEAVGQTFDPNLHNAVMHTEDESLGENTVAQEFQKGYTYRDSVVRHSMVQVAN